MSSTAEIPFEFHHGNGASMWHLEDGSVDLVLTSPPYYPDDLEKELRKPLLKQERLDEVEQAVTSLALSLQPVFHEVARVLKPAGRLILQTKDLRYGGYLIGPLDSHRRLAETAGFRLITEVGWEASPSSITRDRTLQLLWRLGHFVTAETERFLVFSRAPLATMDETEVVIPPEYAEALWKLPAQGSRRTHPQESPISVLRRLISVYSQPGDMVVDPFCGHGTVILVANELDRSGVGYDIDAGSVAKANAKLKRATKKSAR